MRHYRLHILSFFALNETSTTYCNYLEIHVAVT